MREIRHAYRVVAIAVTGDGHGIHWLTEKILQGPKNRQFNYEEEQKEPRPTRSDRHVKPVSVEDVINE